MNNIDIGIDIQNVTVTIDCVGCIEKHRVLEGV